MAGLRSRCGGGTDETGYRLRRAARRCRPEPEPAAAEGRAGFGLGLALAAHQLQVSDAQREVRLALMLTGAKLALHGHLRALDQVRRHAFPALAPRGAVEPYGLLVVAVAGI